MDLLTVVVGLAVLVGLVGIVVPVLPGSLLIGAAVLAWAAVSGTGAAWAVFAVVAVLLLAAASATYVVAGRRVAAAGVPRRSLGVAGLAGIVGFFAVPVVGLLIFFPLGLFLMELLRLGDRAAAGRSALLALKATGLGMLTELGLALLASGTWLIAALLGAGG